MDGHLTSFEGLWMHKKEGQFGRVKGIVAASLSPINMIISREFES